MGSAAHGAGAPGEPHDAVTQETPALSADGPGGGESPASAHAAAAAQSDPFARRPELFVGAAFAGGLIAAQLLKRRTR
jgi:hypothetical protein